MPLHDWTRVTPGIFHDFHQTWAIAIRNDLNSGGLPEGYFALVEQAAGGRIPGVLTLHEPAAGKRNGGVAIAESPPQTRIQSSVETDIYAAKANRIAIHHPPGDVVAVIEIVSPGNKSNRHALRPQVQKEEGPRMTRMGTDGLSNPCPSVLSVVRFPDPRIGCYSKLAKSASARLRSRRLRKFE
jgi:hypothetical protein